MGYGRPFAESVMLKVGVKDAQDTTAAVADFARRNGYTDIYLMGNSYGGYLAMKMLVDNPTRYKGAMSIGGVADWTTLLGNLSNSIFNVQFGGVADEENDNFGVHAAASVYNKLSNLSGQKVVLVHGQSDMTIPYRQAEGLAQYLYSINKPVELVTLEGEDHVFKKKESFELLCQKTLALIGRTDSTSCTL
jgi:dipeptidyl aminopeptidase/acylaminoacyl peptidase